MFEMVNFLYRILLISLSISLLNLNHHMGFICLQLPFVMLMHMSSSSNHWIIDQAKSVYAPNHQFRLVFCKHKR